MKGYWSLGAFPRLHGCCKGCSGACDVSLRFNRVGLDVYVAGSSFTLLGLCGFLRVWMAVASLLCTSPNGGIGGGPGGSGSGVGSSSSNSASVGGLVFVH